MGFLTGKTALITGAGRAVLQDGSCGSIGYMALLLPTPKKEPIWSLQAAT